MAKELSPDMAVELRLEDLGKLAGISTGEKTLRKKADQEKEELKVKLANKETSLTRAIIVIVILLAVLLAMFVNSQQEIDGIKKEKNHLMCDSVELKANFTHLTSDHEDLKKRKNGTQVSLDELKSNHAKLEKKYGECLAKIGSLEGLRKEDYHAFSQIGNKHDKCIAKQRILKEAKDMAEIRVKALEIKYDECREGRLNFQPIIVLIVVALLVFFGGKLVVNLTYNSYSATLVQQRNDQLRLLWFQWYNKDYLSNKWMCSVTILRICSYSLCILPNSCQDISGQ